MKFIDKIANWYFNRNSLPFWCILLIDNAIVVGAYHFTYLLFNYADRTIQNLDMLSLSVLAYLVFYNIAFRLFHTYSGILRYSSFVDLQRVGYATALGSGLSYIAHVLLKPQSEVFSLITGSQIITVFVIATFLMWMVRIVVKMVYDISFASKNSKRAYIFGVKHDGIAIAKHIRNEKPTRFLLKGFATIEEGMEGHVLMGTKVYKIDKDIVETMKNEKIEALIVSPSRLKDFRKNQEFQDELIKAGITIYITQKAKTLSSEEDLDVNSTPQLKEISIEDLLPRDEIQVDMDSVGTQLTGQCIMITGSAGSIGSEMVRQIAVYKPKELLLVDQAETPQHDIRLMMQKEWPDIKAHTIVASICEKDFMEALFKKYRPAYVFHAAAYKHVPMMEDNPTESVRNNIIGTHVIADLAVKYDTKKFVMISTDKAVNPTNVMGC